MKNFLKEKRESIRLLLFFCALISATLIIQIKQRGGPEMQTELRNAYWETKIKKVGAESAYAEFKEYYSDKEFSEQHTAAHIIGKVLYRTVGISGFSICDPSFAFGCYHSFLGQAVAEKGVSIVSDLAKKCKEHYGENSTGCEHGIGHGILEYLGPKKLHEALAVCIQTNQKNPLFGCTSGLFMEYNSHITFEKNTALMQERKPNQKNLYEPCNEIVPEKFRPSCYYEISLWWKNTVKLSDKEIGHMCGTLVNETEQKSCYLGWGAVVAEKANYEPKKISAICMSGTTQQGWGECNAGAIMRLVGADRKNGARALCVQTPPLAKESLCKAFF